MLLGFTFVAVVLMSGARSVSRQEEGLLIACYAGRLAVLTFL